MQKMNCNVIKDLLPSYVDEICSPESRTLVEEHLTECEGCKKLYERTKLEMLHTNISSTKEIDYFKKIKSNVSRKNGVIIGIILLLFALLLYCNLNLYRFDNYFTKYLNYLFPLLATSLLFTILPDHAEHPVPNRLKFTVLGIEFASITYIFGLILYVTKQLLNGQLPFGLVAEKLGPFLQTQICIVSVALLIAFWATLFLSIRKKTVCPALHFLPLGGLALMLEFERLLHEFTLCFNLSMFIRPYILFACEVIVLVGIYLFLNKKR